MMLVRVFFRVRMAGRMFSQGVIGVSEDAIRGDCSTLPGNELDLIAQQVNTAGAAGTRRNTKHLHAQKRLPIDCLERRLHICDERGWSRLSTSTSSGIRSFD